MAPDDPFTPPGGAQAHQVGLLTITQATAHLGGVVPAWQQDRRRAGQRLRGLREAAGLSQLELAATGGRSSPRMTL